MRCDNFLFRVSSWLVFVQGSPVILLSERHTLFDRQDVYARDVAAKVDADADLPSIFHFIEH